MVVHATMQMFDIPLIILKEEAENAIELPSRESVPAISKSSKTSKRLIIKLHEN
jgi:hypothetical protein